jgi:hypothetical protein
VRVSTDGRRANENVVVVDRFAVPSYFQEDIETNAGLDAAEFDYSMGDTSLAAEEQTPDEDGISVRLKAKRYENLVRQYCSFFEKIIIIITLSRTCPSKRGSVIEMSTSTSGYVGREGVTATCIHRVEVAGRPTPRTAANCRRATGRACFARTVLSPGIRCCRLTGFK